MGGCGQEPSVKLYRKTAGALRRRVPRLLPRLSFILALSLLTGCLSRRQSALDPAGPGAARISDLWWLMFYVCAAVYIAVVVFLLIALFRSRSAERQERIKPEMETERRLAKTVTGAVAATIVILFVFLVASFLTGRTLSEDADPNVLTIKVTGHQWWWDIEYQDPVPGRIFRTANEIHLPVGQTVRLQLTSRDVIHSFWVPNIDGKRDLIPGHETNIWLRADQPGVFRGQCAEFCGHQHAHMAFIVVVEPPEQFQAWVAQQRQIAAPPATPAEQRGQQVFFASSCVMCHTIRGTDASGRVAPDLTHLASRQTIAAGTLPNTRGHLGGWIIDSQRIKPGNRMPPNGLSPEDLQALLDYLQNLR